MISVTERKGMSYMRKGETMAAASIVWIAFMMLGLCLSADESSEKLLTATPGEFDAGTVAEGKKVEVTTTVQNIGKTKVEITNVRTS